MQNLELYRQRLKLQDATFSRIEHEDAIIAIVYKVTLPNGIEHILKICTSTKHYECEVYFLNFFADRLPVPHIIHTVKDFCSLEIGHWIKNEEQKNLFLEGYERIRPVPDYKKLMPLLLLSRAIATIGFTVKSQTWQTHNANLYQRNYRYLESLLHT